MPESNRDIGNSVITIISLIRLITIRERNNNNDDKIPGKMCYKIR